MFVVGPVDHAAAFTLEFVFHLYFRYHYRSSNPLDCLMNRIDLGSCVYESVLFIFGN